MYPSTSDFRSDEPGSAWAILVADQNATDSSSASQGGRSSIAPTEAVVRTGDRVLASQWPAMVRAFQRKARQLLPETWTLNLEGLSCRGGSSRSRDAIPTDGRWDAITFEALVALACRMFDDPSVARDLMMNADPRKVQTVPARAVELLIGIAYFVMLVGTPDAPSLKPDVAKQVTRVRLPAGAMLPIVAMPAAAPTATQDWFVIFTPGQEATPTPPAKLDPTTPMIAIQESQSDWRPEKSPTAGPFLFVGFVYAVTMLADRIRRRDT